MMIEPIIANILSEDETFSFLAHKGTGITMPIHRHMEFEIHYVSGGEGLRRTIGGNTETLKGKDLVLVGSNVLHSWSLGDKKPTQEQEDFIIHGIPNLVGNGLLDRHDMEPLKRLKERAQKGIAFGDATISKVEQVIEKIKKTKGQKRTTLLLHIIEILIMMAEADDSRTICEGNPDNAPGETNEKVAKMIDFINNNFCEPIRCEAVSSLVGMTNDGANRCFKRVTGHTILEYIIELRLGYSAKLLASSPLTISEICFRSGFNNLSYFSRCFRSKFSMSPSQFRSRYSK